jgi:dihydropyrimidine dehydrogenase (NADP+)
MRNATKNGKKSVQYNVYLIFFLKNLKGEGYDAIFLGIGMPEPKKISAFEGLSREQGFFTSKEFLPAVSAASKPGKRTT